jgi:hypothetical protein
MQETATLLCGTPEVEPPPGLRQAILGATIYRPTWQQRAREMARRLLPAPPVRGLALAGSAAAILAAAYLSVSRTPQMDPTTQPLAPFGGWPSGERITADKTTLPAVPAPLNVKPKSSSRDDHKVTVPLSHRPSDDDPAFIEDLMRQPVRVVEKKRSFHGPIEPSPAPHLVRNVTHRPLPSDLAPSLGPDREAQPNDMFTKSPMQTADIREPIGPKGGMGILAEPMSKGPLSTRDPSTSMPTALDKGRIIALASSSPETSNAGAMVSLADLRRRLRQQNEVQIVHPEFHLRGQRDNTLDVLKSSF